MLRKGLLISLFILLFGFVNGQEKGTLNKKNSAIVKLDGYIDGYIAMTPFCKDSLITACDYLISFSKDPVIKSHITRHLFEKFYNSEIMGMESIAIHIGKKYYLGKEVELPKDMNLNALQIFIEFNENSLLGMTAPPLLLKNLKDSTVSLSSVSSDFTLVYFFDDQCAVCKKELPLLKEIVGKYPPEKLTVYAVYTQSGKENLKRFIEQEFNNTKANKNWIFVWDPTFESNFQKLYNVIKTPQMFLLDRGKVITGRNLDNQALLQLLEIEYSQKNKQ